jgi:hypothetical protein
MRSHRSQGNRRSSLTQFKWILGICLCLLFLCDLFLFHAPLACALNSATPWSPDASFQNLVYGSSSEGDVTRVMGKEPDEVVRGEQMFPVIENYYYYDENKSGAATVFVFENGMLVGLQMKTAGNQFVDLTYFLANNGDRYLNSPLLNGYMPYYPLYPLTSW